MRQRAVINMNEKVIRRKTSYTTKFLAAVLLFTVTASLIGLLSGLKDGAYAPVAVSDPGEKAPVIVLDAGHGGEDGGASSDSGIAEKDINLTISKLCGVILAAGGCDVRFTRTDDRLIYDMYDDLKDYTGHKKMYDLRNRVRFAEEAGADVFVSIHLNKFHQPQYGGAQVYYSPNDPASSLYAGAIKETLRDLLQSDNDRAIKKATSSISILKSITLPAVLIECGFLSNPADLENLTDPGYQLSLALCISTSLQKQFAAY